MKGFKNSTRTQKGHSFPTKHGFTGSSGEVRSVKPYTRSVPMKKAEGGYIGNCATQRTQPVTETDKREGGKGPLLPGYSKGGRSRK